MKSSTSSARLSLPPPIRLELHASVPLALFLLAAHAGALFCLMAIEPMWPIKLPMGIAILWSAVFTLCEHAFRCSRSAITTLAWTQEGVWKLWTRDGRLVSAWDRQLSGKQSFLHRAPGVRIYVHAHIVVLRFSTQSPLGRPVILHPGMVDDGEAFRRLRVRLRFSSEHPGGHASNG